MLVAVGSRTSFERAQQTRPAVPSEQQDEEEEQEEEEEEDSKPSPTPTPVASPKEDLSEAFARSARIQERRSSRERMTSSFNWSETKDLAQTYTWVDGVNQQHCSLDIIVPSGETDWFEPSVSDDGLTLILKKRVPGVFLSAGRLVMSKKTKAQTCNRRIPSTQELAVHSQVQALTTLCDKIPDCGIEVRQHNLEVSYWVVQKYSLPFKCDRDLWKDPEGVEGWEVLVFQHENIGRGDLNENNQMIFVVSVELLSVIKPRRVERTRANAMRMVPGEYIDPRLG